MLHRDICTWTHGNVPGYTFHSPQYVSTQSRLDWMSVMHNVAFSPEVLDISVSYDLVLSDHFLVSVCFCASISGRVFLIS